MNRLIAIPIFIMISIASFGQGVEVIQNDTIDTYTNKSYDVLYNLKLKAGFSASAATDGHFYAKARAFHVAPQSGTIAHRDTDIMITCPAPVDMGSVAGAVTVYGDQTGVIPGTWNQTNRTLTFNPSSDFNPGELIMTTIDEQLLNQSGDTIHQNYTWQFIIASDPSPLQPTSFGSGRAISGALILNNPMAVYPADVDQDGDIDIVSATEGDDYIIWHENLGNEMFNNHFITHSFRDAVDVLVADMDADGDMDIVAALDYNGGVQLFKNDGNQNFTSQAVTSGGSWPESITTTDLDSDGDLDMLMISDDHDRVTWLRNANGSSFASITIPSTIVDPSDIFAVDLDNDGDIDFLTASTADDKISWYKNDGNESFMEIVISDTADYALSVYASDLDGDGDIDVLSASRNDNTIAWYENDGVQNFTVNTITTLAIGASNVITSDVDGDGDLDILSTSATDRQISWFENLGGTSFPLHNIGSGPGLVKALATADINNDGDMDVISVNTSQRQISWYEYGNDARDILSFTVPGQIGSSIIDTVNYEVDVSILVGVDLTNIAPDFVLSPGARAFIGPAYQASGVVTDFTNPVTYTIEADNGTTQDWTVTVHYDYMNVVSYTPQSNAIVKADSVISLRFDDIADLTSLSTGLLIQGDQTGLLAGVWSLQDSIATFDPINDFRSGELITVTVTEQVFNATGTKIAPKFIWHFLIESGAAPEDPLVFSNRVVYTTPGQGISSVYAADMDGDGDMDAISASYSAEEIRWHENNGAGAFTTHNIFHTWGNGTYVRGVDMDQDGVMDILSCSNNTINYHRNNQNGTFALSQPFISNSANYARFAETGDLDADGDIDFIAATTDLNTLGWFENNGSEVFTEHTLSNAIPNLSSADISDIDGDGDLDLLISSRTANEVSWMINDGLGNFSDLISIGTVNWCSAVEAVDLDGDNDIDILAGGSLSSELWWFENDGTQNFAANGAILAQDAFQVHDIRSSDLDGDGDMDIIVGGGATTWYENNGSELFVKNTIDSNDASSVFTADIDGDSDIDLLAVYDDSNDLVWHRNVTSQTDIVAFSIAEQTSPATLDLSNHIVEVVVSSGTSLTNTIPTFVLSPGATAYINSVEQQSGVNANDFSNIVTYTIASEDSVTTQPWTVIISAEKMDLISFYPSFNERANIGTDIGLVLSDTVDLTTVSSSITVRGSQSGMIGGGWSQLGNSLTFDPLLDFYPGEKLTVTINDQLLNDSNDQIGPVYAWEFFAKSGVSLANPTLFSQYQQTSPSSPNGWSTSAMDLDNDQDLDLVYGTSSVNELIWQENVGGNSFIKHSILLGSDNAWSSQAVDLDNDGDGDIIAGIGDSFRLVWFENNGGVFTEHLISSLNGRAEGVTYADFDRDGDIDVLSARSSGPGFAWYENDGDEVFIEHRFNGTSNPSSMNVSDMDQDGDSDFLIGVSSGLFWYENNGYGSFTEHAISDSFNGPVGINSADFDLDGDLDLAVAWRFSDLVAWYENDGNQIFVEHVLIDSLDDIRSVRATDIDGDGDGDILSASGSSRRVDLYTNDGAGNFINYTLEIGLETFGLATGDLDNDGDIDVTIGPSWLENRSGTNITAFSVPGQVGTTFIDSVNHIVDVRVLANTDLQNLVATFLISNGALVTLGGIVQQSGITPNDFTNDLTYKVASDDGVTFQNWTVSVGYSTLDLFSYTPASNSLMPQNAQIAIIFSDTIDLATTSSGIKVTGTQSGLISGSWIQIDTTLHYTPDMSFFPGEEITVALNDSLLNDLNDARGPSFIWRFTVEAAASVTSPISFSDEQIISSMSDGANSVSVADMDNDGDIDIIGVSAYLVEWHENIAGTFTPHMISNTETGYTDALAVDLDADGDMDIISTSNSANKIIWHINDGLMGYTDFTISTAANRPSSVQAADLDGDGDLDIMSTSNNDDEVNWYENQNNTSFMFHNIFPHADYATSLQTADLDNDGDIDIVATNSNGNDHLTWFQNDGGGSFMAFSIANAGPAANQVVTSDIDSDGDNDLVVIFTNRMAWFENDGNGVFVEHEIADAINNGRSVHPNDMDGDGDIDILLAVYNSDKISWFENDGQETFIEYTISTMADAALSVAGADLDGDGDMDVLSASSRDDKIAWYESGYNETELLSFSVPGQLGATVIDTLGHIVHIKVPIGTDRSALVTSFALSPGASAYVGTQLQLTGSTANDFTDMVRYKVTAANEFDFSIWDVVIGYESFSLASFTPTQLAVTPVDSNISLTFSEPVNVLSLDSSVTIEGSMSGIRTGTWSQISSTATFDPALDFYPGESVIVRTTAGIINNLQTKVADGYGWEFVAATGLSPENPAVFSGDSIVTTSLQNPRDIVPIDMDGDEDLDVLSLSNNSLDWHENDLSGVFITHQIESVGSFGWAVHASDLDSDDDMDIILVSRWTTAYEFIWYENNGSQIFTPHQVNTSTNYNSEVFTSDLNNDGHTDVILGSDVNQRVFWMKNDGHQNFSEYSIASEPLLSVQSLSAFDIDGDGDQDVLSASNNANRIDWYENNGVGSFTSHIVASSVLGANSVSAGDIDLDGDADVLSSSGLDDKITWYENDGSENFDSHIITASSDYAISALVVDMDGDGDMDVLSSASAGDKVSWHENDGLQQFTEHVISLQADNPMEANFGDMDGDGDMDVLSTSINDDKIVWYENTILANAGARFNEKGQSLTEAESAEEMSDGILLYPNPAKDQFVVEIDEIDGASIEVYDLIGNLLLKHEHLQESKTVISLKRYTAGLLIVNVIKSGQVRTFKLMVEK